MATKITLKQLDEEILALLNKECEGNASIAEYTQDTSFKKDTLIYCGDRLGRAAKDFISDDTEFFVDDGFTLDINNGNIVLLGNSGIKFSIEVADSLYDVIKENVIYLIPSDFEEDNNIYEEYMLINSKPELIGSTRIDLTDYATKEYVDGVVSSLPTIDDTTSSTDNVYSSSKVDELISAIEIPDEYELPIATENELGGVKIGDNINIDADGKISVTFPDMPVASEENLGGIKIGEGLTIDEDGKVNVVFPDEYELPIASDTELGGIKVGENLEISADGTLKAVIPEVESEINDDASGPDSTYSSQKIDELLSAIECDVIEDSAPAADKTYSSEKIEELLSSFDSGTIDDTTSSSDTTYSSEKIDQLLADNACDCDLIDDENSSSDKTYSSNKIDELLEGLGTGNAIIVEYEQGTAYTKDTLVYHGDRLGRVSADFTSDDTQSDVEESFYSDVMDGHIIVDQIDITELESSLIKAIPIVGFISKKDVSRFESGLTLDGSIPTFRDGTHMNTDEKKACNFFYIMDNNEELTGLALVMSYDENDDEFVINAMKYGVGTTDSILSAKGALTKRTVGDIQILHKDAILDPKFIMKSTPPEDNTKLWYETSDKDAYEITIDSYVCKKYDPDTQNWTDTELVDVRESDVIKNANGDDWEYYKIYEDGNVFVSIGKWELVYDYNNILGKIIDIDFSKHELTIRTIHANSEQVPYLEEDIQANTAVGAAAEDFLYPEGMSLTELVKKIAIQDILATVELTAVNSGLVKKGESIDSTVLTATITDVGNVPIKKVTFYRGNAKLEEQDYIEGTYTYTYNYDTPITTNTSFIVVVEQEDNRFVREVTRFTFVNPIYVGVVNSLTPNIQELNEVLKDTKDNIYKTTINDGRVCYAYPSSMGNLTSIKDNNGLEYLNSFTKSTDTVNGETYNIYILTDEVTVDNFTWIFN